MIFAHQRRPLAVAVGTFVLAAVAAAALIWQLDSRDREQQRARVHNLASARAGILQRNIEHGLSASYALAALVRQGKGAVPNFNEVAGEMLAFYPGVSELALAPEGVIREVVPLAGNEQALGHKLLQDPAQAKEALRARDSGKLTLAGPLNLVQGGVGVVGRLPVFLDDAAGKPRFWGFTLVMMRFPGLLEGLRLPRLTQRGFAYELWRIHPDTGQKQVMAASAAAVIEPVEDALQVPNATWTLSIAPAGGWGDPRKLAFEAALGLLFSLLLAYLAKSMLELQAHRAGLQTLVEQRTAEARAREADLNRAQSVAGVGSWVLDPVTKELRGSAEAMRILGLGAGAALDYREFLECVHPEDRAAVDSASRASLKGLPYDIEYRVLAGGETRWVRSKAELSFDAQGRMVNALGTIQDITERKLADHVLRASESRYRELFEESPQPMWVYDLQTLAFVAVNDAAVAHYGYSREEFLAMLITDIRPRETVPRLLQHLAAVRRQNMRDAGVWQHRKRDGTLIDVEIVAHTFEFDGRRARMVLVNDVSERQRAEHMLRQSEARFRSLSEMSSDFYWESDSEHRLSLLSTGDGEDPARVLPRGTPLGRRRWEVPYLSPDAAGWEAHRAVLDAHRPFRDFEISRLGADGVPHYVAISGDPVFDASGVFQGYRGVGKNISERKAAQAKIARLTQLYAALSQCNQAIVRCTDEAELLQQICRVAVDFGGMKIAWIGFADPATQNVNIVARHGDHADEYLQGAEVSVDAASPLGQGPTGIAMRENRPVWCRDFQGLALTAPWHERRARFDWKASASLPLRRGGVTAGVLTLYADDAAAFDEAGCELLTEMAEDISFALDNFERESRRRQSEAALHESETRFRSLTEMSSDFYWESDAEHRLIARDSANRMLSTISAFQRGAHIGERRWEIPYLSPDEAGWRAHREVLDAHLPFRGFELSRLGVDGTERHLSISGDPVFDASGAFKGYRGVGTDITERKRAEAHLRLAAIVFNHAHDAITVTDADANIITVNRQFTQITGYSADEVIGRNPRILKSGRQDSAFYRAMWASIASEGYWIGEVWNRSKDGRIYPELLSISAVRDERGRVSNYVAVFVDLSERIAAEQALAESEARFRSLTEMSSDFYWESDAGHRIVQRGLANRSDTLWTFQRGAQVGERRWEVPALSPDEAGWQAHKAVLDAHLPFRNFELSRLGTDGEEHYVSISGDPVFDADGVFKGYRGVGTDITERRRHEALLRRLNEELEQRVVQRTQALAAANMELEAFSYSVSHDLRAPLRVIEGFSRLLQAEYAQKLDEQGKDYLRRMSAGAAGMHGLISDLLKLSRVSRQEMRIESVDLSALARELAEELQQAEPARRVEWLIAPQLRAEGDPGLLRLVLQNLLGNAWKYSSKRDSARIEFGLAEKDGRRVFFVRDNGAGFDMDRAEKLFGAFQRLHSAAEFPGSGIGLATVARIVHRHGGEVGAEGRIGEGATFHFSLG